MSGSADPVGLALSRARELMRHLMVRTTRSIYLGVENSPAAPVLNSDLVQRLKSHVTYVPADVVLRVLDALREAGVQAWLAGGWGVDALAGRQTRRHYDVDIVVSEALSVRRAVARALAAIGFREATVEHNEGLPMPVRWAWRDDNGCQLDVLPVVLHQPPFGPRSFAHGCIDGQLVPCLSPALQLALHGGYAPRDIEEHDLDLLREAGRPQT
jgi:lincosamide nucleotidyltransferase A/C/D/E